jgi:hypothetical protein
MPRIRNNAPVVNLEDMTFGIEFELTVPAGSIRIGSYYGPSQVEGFPTGWVAKSDASISVTIPGHVGAEIVSPVLRGANGLLQVAEVLGKLNAIGARINTSCGCHVHIGFPRAWLPKLGHVAYLTANLESALYAATGTKNRERNHFCRPIKQTGHVKDFNFDAVAEASDASLLTRPYSLREQVNGTDGAVATIAHTRTVTPRIGERYAGLNLTNLHRGAKPTVEFRMFQGTTNIRKAVAYIRLCLGIVQKGVESARRVAWDVKGRGGLGGDENSPLNGKENMQRAFYRLGWNRGSTGKVYGNLAADGLDDIEGSKAILMQMAAKYDTRR